MSYLPQRLPELMTSEVLHSKEEQEWERAKGREESEKKQEQKRESFLHGKKYIPT